MKSTQMVTTIVSGIALAASTLAAIGFLSGCAYPISCACRSAVPELPNPAASESKLPAGVDPKQNEIAGVSSEERTSQ